MDIAVCVPLRGWRRWLAEGDLAGEISIGHGHEYGYRIAFGLTPRDIKPGERVYVICNHKLRGYSKLIRVEHYPGSTMLIRGSEAVALTIDRPIKSFQNYMYRFWDRSEEHPFPTWYKL